MKLIKDRYDFIPEYCKGKDVLDLGSVGEDYKTPKWLFPKIKSVANSIVGVDSKTETVKEVNELGHPEIIVGNVTNLNLTKKFDVITAGELIEHVSDMGAFLKSVRKHLKDDGIFVLSTPNAYALNLVVKSLFGVESHHGGHIVFFDLGTLKELLESHGFTYVSHHYNTEYENTFIRSAIIRLVGTVIPKLNIDIVMVAKKSETF